MQKQYQKAFIAVSFTPRLQLLWHSLRDHLPYTRIPNGIETKMKRKLIQNFGFSPDFANHVTGFHLKSITLVKQNQVINLLQVETNQINVNNVSCCIP